MSSSAEVMMRRGIRGRILVLAAVTLLAGASLCILDADDGTGMDLCHVVLLATAGVVLGAPRPLVGRVVPVVIPIHAGGPLDRPFRPPRP
jgi:hypothetical protein